MGMVVSWQYATKQYGDGFGNMMPTFLIFILKITADVWLNFNTQGNLINSFPFTLVTSTYFYYL